VNVYVIRHGETAWSLSGQHTGTTDIPLTDNGRRFAERLRPLLAKEVFAAVFCSPMQRARETCDLAGLGNRTVIDTDLVEWNYGEYEGQTPKKIHEVAPGWIIFRDARRTLDRVPRGHRKALPARYGHVVRARLLPRDSRREGFGTGPFSASAARRPRVSSGNPIAA
jgi:broad specificity phosphatase PhoE